MYNSTHSLLKSIGARFKKYLILFILLPILTGAAAYFLADEVQVTHTATATIELGNFENERYTDLGKMKNLLTTTYFLNEINEKHNLGVEPEKIKGSLGVASDSQSKTLTLTITGDDEQEIQQQLSAVVKGTLEETNALYEKKVAILEETLEAVKNINTDSEPVTQQELLYDLRRTTNTEIRKNLLLEDVQISSSQSVSPIQKAILGMIAGFILDLFILILPELFKGNGSREQKI